MSAGGLSNRGEKVVNAVIIGSVRRPMPSLTVKLVPQPGTDSLVDLQIREC